MTPWKTKFHAALEPLRWGFAAGDDGDSISLALDELDSLLRELPKFKKSNTRNLAELLHEVFKDSELYGVVEELSRIGSRSRYGEGLDPKDAKKATRQAEVLSDAIEDIVSKLSRSKKTSKRATKAVSARLRKGQSAKR